MPFTWKAPEVAFWVTTEGGEFAIYHAYKDQSFEGRMTYWYTLDVSEDPDNEFDIRDVAGNRPVEGGMRKHKEVLQEALAAGSYVIEDGDPPEIKKCEEQI
jgi:hypothetical protein